LKDLAYLVYTSLTGERLVVSGIQLISGLDKQNKLIRGPVAGQRWNCDIAVIQNHSGHITPRCLRYYRKTEGDKTFLTSSILPSKDKS